MAPRGFQEPSWGPLRAILERSCPSWRELGVSGGDLGASWGDLGPSRGDLEAILGDLGAILGAQGGLAWERGRRHLGTGWPPLETFCESFLYQGT